MRCTSIPVAFAAAIAGSQAGASTVTFYYVGAPALVSRISESDSSGNLFPLPFNTGSLTIDRSKLEGGTLANTRLTYPVWYAYESDYRPTAPEAVTGVSFAAYEKLSRGDEVIAFDLTFDENENLTSWKFDGYDPGRAFDGYYFRVYSDPIDRASYTVPVHEDYQYWNFDGVEWISYQVLEEKGYGPYLAPDGWHSYHPDHGSLVCGNWTGIDFCSQDEFGNFQESGSAAWSAQLLATDPGQWFKDDPIAFARQVMLNTQFALLNPPKSYDDIPRATPVPLPGGLPLIAGGLLAGAAFLRWRRAAA